MANTVTESLDAHDHGKARRRFGLWSLVVFILLLPPWWLWGADMAAAGLKPLVSLMVRLFGMTGEINVLANGDWSFGTDLTRQGEALYYTVTQINVRKLLLSVPLTLAFLSAPPRTPNLLRAGLISLVVLIVVFILSLVCAIWGDLAAQLNPSLATSRANMVATLDQPPLHPILAQIAIVGRYIGLTIAPLIVSVMLWACLNNGGRSLLIDEELLREKDQ